jgi:hypothetical protein
VDGACRDTGGVDLGRKTFFRITRKFTRWVLGVRPTQVTQARLEYRFTLTYFNMFVISLRALCTFVLRVPGNLWSQQRSYRR